MIKSNYIARPTMPTLPRSENDLPAWIRDFSELMADELFKRPPSGTAVASVLLVSPSGIVYTVSVQDDGTLNTKVFSR